MVDEDILHIWLVGFRLSKSLWVGLRCASAIDVVCERGQERLQAIFETRRMFLRRPILLSLPCSRTPLSWNYDENDLLLKRIVLQCQLVLGDNPFVIQETPAYHRIVDWLYVQLYRKIKRLE